MCLPSFDPVNARRVLREHDLLDAIDPDTLGVGAAPGEAFDEWHARGFVTSKRGPLVQQELVRLDGMATRPISMEV